jgi:orotate phosphoribosyltransferase
MYMYNHSEFLNFIKEQKIVGYFDQPITLKSGEESNWYVNWRHVTNEASTLLKTAQFILDYCKDHHLNFESFYGVPEGATKIGVAVSLLHFQNSENKKELGFPVCMGRGKPKIHGASEDKYFIGMPKGKTLVLEDVTTTGGSLFDAIDKSQGSRINIVGAISLTDRSDGNVARIFEERYKGKIPFYALSKSEDLFSQQDKAA